MKKLKYYCILPSKLSNKALFVLADKNHFDKWENYYENLSNQIIDGNIDLPFELDKEKRPNVDVHFPFGDIIISERFKQLIENKIGYNFQFLPFGNIKNCEYFLLHCSQSIACIDYELSKLITYPSNENNTLSGGNPIFFKEELIPKNTLLFKINIKDSSFFCTQEMVDIVIENKITGVGFRDPRIHELTHIAGNTENPVPEVDMFKLNIKK